MVTPIVMFIGAVLYVFVISQHAEVDADQDRHLRRRRLSRPAGADAVLKNAISKRQLQIKRAFPDALDLLLICYRSPAMYGRVALPASGELEIVSQSVALSPRNFTQTSADCPNLQDPARSSYENLAAPAPALRASSRSCRRLSASRNVYGHPAKAISLRVDGGRKTATCA
jgi:tight adherence protein C